MEWYPIESVMLKDSIGEWQIVGHYEYSPIGPILPNHKKETINKGFLNTFKKPGVYKLNGDIVFDTSATNTKWRTIQSNEFVLSNR